MRNWTLMMWFSYIFLCQYFSFTGETSWGCRISWVTDVWLCNQIQWSLELIVKSDSFTKHNFHSRFVLWYHLIIYKLVFLNWIENFKECAFWIGFTYLKKVDICQTTLIH